MVSLEEGGVWQEWIARDRTANDAGTWTTHRSDLSLLLVDE